MMDPVAFNLFIIPYDLVPNGIYGLGALIYYHFDYSAPMFLLIINLALIGIATLSISAENTFEKDILAIDELLTALKPISEELNKRIKKSGINGRTITLKIKFSDFTQQTRSKTQEQYLDEELIWAIAQELLSQESFSKSIRLLGLGISNLNIIEEHQHFGEQLKIPFEAQL